MTGRAYGAAMPDSELQRKVEAAAEAAQRAGGMSRAVLILAAMGLALAVLGLGLSVR